MLALFAFGVVWAGRAASPRRSGSTRPSVLAVEAAADRRPSCALSLDVSLAVLGALAVPPFTAGLRRGPRGMLLALSAELIPLVVLSAILYGGR